MIYRLSDIDKIISNIVVSYLNEGYSVVLSRIPLSYPYVVSYIELFKRIDKSKYSVACVYLRNKYIYSISTREISILVNKLDFKDDGDSTKRLGAIADEGDKGFVSKQSFYEIRFNKGMYADANSFEEVRKKISLRHENRIAAINKEDSLLHKSIGLKSLSNNFIDSIMRRINRVHGFSKALSTCITSIELVYSGGVIRNTSDCIAYEVRVNIANKTKTDKIILRSCKTVRRRNYQVSNP